LIGCRITSSFFGGKLFIISLASLKTTIPCSVIQTKTERLQPSKMNETDPFSE